jgi:hypothetical protein
VPAPGAGGPNRTALFVTLGVLLAVAAVVLIVALAGGDDDEPQTASNTTEVDDPVTTVEIEDPPATEPVETTAPDDPPEAGGDISNLEVVEDGFSTYADTLSGDTTGSYGFLIENTGEQTVVAAEISVTIADEAGTTVKTDSYTVGIIRPGETLGYGDELYGANLANGIGSLEVQFGEGISSSDAPPEGTLTVSNVNTTNDDYSTTTTFTVASDYADQVDFAEPYAIYRDANENIIGGGTGFMDFIPPGGEQTGEISSFEAIPNIATTEVYVDPGLFF